MSVGGVLLALLCNILWGTAIPFIKMGTKALAIAPALSNQFFFAGIRFTLSGLMLFAFCLITRKRFPAIKKRNRSRVAAITLLSAVLQYGCMYVGLVHIKSVDGSIFSSLSGFVAVILAPVFFKDDKLTANKVVGVLLGLTGVLLISLKGGGISLSLNGEFLLLISTLCYVMGNFMTKKLGKEETALDITACNLLLGGLVLLSMGVDMGGCFGTVSAVGILCLLYLALLSALAFTIWSALLARYKASSLGVFNLVNPIVGTFLAAVLVGEDFPVLKYVIALLLVSLGIIVVNRPEKAKE